MTTVQEPLTGQDLAAGSEALGPWDQAMQLVLAGGPVVLILFGCSIVALAVMFMKLYQFMIVGVQARRSARQAVALCREVRLTAALAQAESGRGVAAAVIAHALRGRLRSDLPEAGVREEVWRVAGDMLEPLRSHLRTLEVIAALAPLLGLFGTVLGMIEAFRQLEMAGAQVDPSILSGGIWEALLTTAVGLAVAIPTVAVLNVFERTLDRLAHDLESLVTQVFTQDFGLAASPAADWTADANDLSPAVPSTGR